MKTLTTLLLTLGLCGLSLPAFAGPSCDANADESLNVMDIVAIVDAVLNPDTVSANCAGPGCEECADITSNDGAVCGGCTQSGYDSGYSDGQSAGYAEGVASVQCPDITSDNQDVYAQACADAGLEVDCNGTCGGGAIVDCQGVCGGGTITDCAGVCGGTAITDECDVCNGDGSSCAVTCYSTDFNAYYNSSNACFESVECCTAAGGVDYWVDVYGCAKNVSGWIYVAMCQ